MQTHRNVPLVRFLLLLAGVSLAPFGCKVISNSLTKWQMLDQNALDDPIQAVGGDGIVFSPSREQSIPHEKLASATPNQLVEYYMPVFIQQRVNTKALKHPYPQEYDQIGTAQLTRDEKGELKALVQGDPAVYAIYQKVRIGNADHIQLTYTAWYPAHPKMKLIDLEEADIDSCVLRVTLDQRNCPILYETIAACGCFHKAFVERWVEAESSRSFGVPESGKKFSVERTVKGDIDWEVAGLIDEPKDRPGRPVVFVKAGDHKVIGVGSTSRLKVPAGADVRKYHLADYAELYQVKIAGTQETGPFFDLGNGGKVRGAERKERYLLGMFGVDAAGQPRANDQIKLHFDQSTWSDPTIYERFLRLPPGTF